ncbi:MAG: NAD-dependent epimerase/dehydratase family protein [Lentimicrobiaceae bacterium]|nr:NAD-dependent epimerase/dehydratase family protein [Lentimicrobiaceae bacterium]
MSKKNILITGAFGFVGTNISVRLSENQDFILYALDINCNQNNKNFIGCYDWDSFGELSKVKFDTIIHLAGKAHDTKNRSLEQSYIDINVGLTEKIFDFFINTQSRKFIFFSSVKAVSDKVKGEFLTEDSEPDPQTPYGKSKRLAEKYILSKKTESFQKIYILRPCMIHGAGNKGNLNLLYNLVSKGIPWPLGSFHNKRSFLSIENLSFILEKLIENEAESDIYQVSDDEPLSTNNLIEIIACSLNKKIKIWNLSPKLVRFAAKTGDFFYLPLNSERLKKLTESYVVSNSKIKNALNLVKMPVTAYEGMKKTIEIFTSSNAEK